MICVWVGVRILNFGILSKLDDDDRVVCLASSLSPFSLLIFFLPYTKCIHSFTFIIMNKS
jgi:hypothetical protein